MAVGMAQGTDTLETGFRQFEGFRTRIKQDVDVLVSELSKTSRRNLPRMESTCAKIELLTREYQAFLGQLNALRIACENETESRDALIQIRREWGILTSRTNLFRVELARWHEVAALVRAQMKPKRQKLYVPAAKTPPTAMAQLLASDDVFKRFHALFSPNPQSEAARDHRCFPDIGLANSDFHAHMHAAYRLSLARKKSRPARFLDVGCGAGMKVYSALRYWEEAVGFDFDPVYVSAGTRFLDLDPDANASVFEQDALTFDGYDAFDIIYFYRPINDEDLMAELEQRIASIARPGTILIAPYLGFTRRFTEAGCGHVDGAVYLTQTTQKKADFWRRKAECVGEFVSINDREPAKTVWSPIFDASRANGVDFPSVHEKPKY